ncbi:unnamed protein product [Paramecium sonneborni]|uniref:Uncharacterized protein n=1 Tax=Paramecium sonneborni TaxID=65129 RepID=A0A8S1QV51_9CILI|nr:unnamed protein product [Paramecium sonneborni]
MLNYLMIIYLKQKYLAKQFQERMKFIKIFKNLKIDLYSTKITYLMVNLNNMQIIKNQNNAQDFFKVDQLMLDDLILNGIKDYYSRMIKQFIMTGQSNFLEKFKKV